MSFITGIDSEEKVSAAFYSKDVNVVNGVPQAETYTLVATVSCLQWFGTRSVGFVSDKIKTQVESILATDYDASIAAIKDNSRVTISGENYQVLTIENVGMQNEVLQVYLKREASN
jgi:hypothetical protein